MTPLISIALLMIVAVGAWGWMRHNRAKDLAEQRAREESERIATEARLAHEKALAAAKAAEDARLQAEAEERIREQAKAIENERLTEEQRLADKGAAAEAEAKRRAEEEALADAQAREAARMKAEAEAKQRAEAEAREKARLAAEESQRAEERRQEERARAEEEERERGRLAGEEDQRQAEATVEKERTESDRLATEARPAHEKALAAAKAAEDARLQAEAEERIREQAKAIENERLAEEQRLADKGAAAEAEAKRRAEEEALADAQAREAARMKAEAEAKQRAEAEAREKARLAAEESQRAEERRQEERARAKEEERERGRLAGEEDQRQAEATVEKERTESDRLATEARPAHEKALAAAKAAEDARLQAEAEERIREQAKAIENERLAEEQRLAEERVATEAEEERCAKEKALADAQAGEAGRMKAEAEAKQEAEAEARERARLAAEAELQRQTEVKAEKKRISTESHAEAPPPQNPSEPDEALRPPTYQPPAPPPTTSPPRPPRPPRPPHTPLEENANAILHLRVQLVFGRGGVIRNLALAPDRRDGMPSDIQVVGTQGELHLTELREDCYEPVVLTDAGNALPQGIEWRGRGDARRWSWVLGGRELYVLAPGDEFGLHGFVSTARLWLNARHVVLATKRLRGEVLAALAQAGCATPEVNDNCGLGVPAGWLLFRDVIPTRAVPMRDERDILNALCPAHNIEPHFVGGIKLERTTWLVGYPPRIRFTGEFTNGFEVRIDGRLTERARDGAFEASGWDSEGEHRLWFGDRAETYSLRTMEESWEQWHAHNFGMGAAICGASTCQLDATRQRQVRVPPSNPLLIGSRPGEISYCYVRGDIRCETVLAMVSFEPVWALPVDPAHVDKRTLRIVLLHPSQPQNDFRGPTGNRAHNQNLAAWTAAVCRAGCKGLRLAPEDERTKLLWQRYRTIAKQIRRKMR